MIGINLLFSHSEDQCLHLQVNFDILKADFVTTKANIFPYQRSILPQLRQVAFTLPGKRKKEQLLQMGISGAGKPHC